MPELAEVAFFAKQWRQAVGQRVSVRHISERARCCRELDRDEARRALEQVRLREALTHGKRMLFGFDGGRYLEVHLGMTGELLMQSLDTPLGKHDHFVLAAEDGQLVFRDPRQFGRIVLRRSDGIPEWWTFLPPQPHDAGFTRAVFDQICHRRARSQIKPVLLDQTLFPGVGNWMADEILWQARIRPQRTFESLGPQERTKLYQKTRSVCRGALETVGEDYRDPPASWLFRHRWKPGGTCPKTGQPLARDTVGGRSTCWSPAWQK